MTDHFITLTELLLLVAFLGAPTVLVATICQVMYLRSHRVGQRGTRLQFSLLVAVTALAIYTFTAVLWAVIPSNVLDWPGARGDWPFMIAGVFFVPSLLAAVVVVPAATWIGRRIGAGRRRN